MRDRGVPHAEVGIDQAVGAGTPGIEERHVDVTELVERDVGEATDLLEIGHVGGDADGLVSVGLQLNDCGIQSVDPSCREHHLHPTRTRTQRRWRGRCRWTLR